MAMLLHLSDLHLTSPVSEVPANDAKTAVILAESQQLPFNQLRTTLDRLAAWLRDNEQTLDSVVITGDIADRNDPGGYARLPQLLEPLVGSVVAPDRVVILPGNHDVRKGSSASTPERYENFLTVRDQGYVTPLLEGIDIHEGTAASADVPILVATDESYIVVALNSANHSQVQTAPESLLDGHMDELDELRSRNVAVEALWQAWTRRGEYDPAWIGPEQLRLASDALHAAAHSAPNALRIVALHHQLLPVGTIAEIKPFETISNLGEVLQWISDNGIDVVLHGHKHVDGVAEANTSPMTFGAPGVDRRVLLVSSPSARPNGRSPVARLIDVPPLSARAGGVRLADIPLAGPGRTLAIAWAPHVLDEDVSHGLVRGRTVDDVHSKLMALSKEQMQAFPLLTCVIEDGASALNLPGGYPDAPVARAEQADWFKAMVDWWQSRAKGTAAKFNHGERIRAYVTRGTQERVDQLDVARATLRAKESSTRAIAILIDPARDFAGQGEPAFPAFALVQFLIKGAHLDVIGYFRKQEMPHWWPVNVGELARLQQHLVREIGDGLAAGSITTITPRPVHGGGVPRVSVPSLDQWIDEPTGLLRLVLPLFAASTDGAACRNRWSMAFSDWEPAVEAPADGEPMPVEGLTRLTNLIKDVGAVHGTSPNHDRLRDGLTALRDACSRRLTVDEEVNSDRTQWLAAWRGHRDRILGLVDETLAHHNETDPVHARSAE